jgi:hypothetical protein
MTSFRQASLPYSNRSCKTNQTSVWGWSSPRPSGEYTPGLVNKPRLVLEMTHQHTDAHVFYFCEKLLQIQMAERKKKKKKKTVKEKKKE